jgi:hypothetical protein
MQGYAAVHVDPVEVGAKLDKHLPGLPIAVVGAKMHLPIRSVWALFEDREGGALLETMVFGAPNGQHVFRGVMPDVIERFQKTYATTARIAAILNVSRILIERELRSARLRPSIPFADVGVDLYRTDDLPSRYWAEARAAA